MNEHHAILLEAGVPLSPGLTEAELALAEDTHGFRFPPDLRAMLASCLPTGPRFPNWRAPDSDVLRHWLEGPFEGLAFDISNDAFWNPAWGTRPEATLDAIELARAHVHAAPRLIPIAGHRYIAAEPEREGNPVYSVHQSDIIFYGRDLASYLRCEFLRLPWEDAVSGEILEVPLWSDLIELNG